MCGRGGALFTVNDDVELARRCGADGAHLGQRDESVAAAREVLSPEAVIGLSAGSAEEAWEGRRSRGRLPRRRDGLRHPDKGGCGRQRARARGGAVAREPPDTLVRHRRYRPGDRPRGGRSRRAGLRRCAGDPGRRRPRESRPRPARYPGVSVSADLVSGILPVREDGRLLLLLRPTGTWDPPAGRLATGENFAAMRRPGSLRGDRPARGAPAHPRHLGRREPQWGEAGRRNLRRPNPCRRRTNLPRTPRPPLGHRRRVARPPELVEPGEPRPRRASPGVATGESTAGAGPTHPP